MSELEFNIFQKQEIFPRNTGSGQRYDLLLSAYNSSERVRIVFDRIQADVKAWAIHHEYGFNSGELPAGFLLQPAEDREAAYIRDAIATVETHLNRNLHECAICIDTTGFMRPHLLYLLVFLFRRGVKFLDVLYTEPVRYTRKEKTKFSDGQIVTRQVEGFEGLNSPDANNDFLIIGSGYDFRLIKAVAEHKSKADKVQIFGLPSLQADMYQENVLSALKVQDAVGTNKRFDEPHFFAPANDPFSTAGTISEIVRRRESIGPISKLYLSPLATKAQAVGFGFYYIKKKLNSSCSILFPVSTTYERETSEGLSRIWRYRLEF